MIENASKRLSLPPLAPDQREYLERLLKASDIPKEELDKARFFPSTIVGPPSLQSK
ncbi:MAG: hypothetical protein AAB573_00410 [Patescibacteria group bacterium]